jgi:hypothetical protein
MARIRSRLVKLENERRFLDWFVWARFFDSLTEDELETHALGESLPDPFPNRPSNLDSLDRKSLIKLWKEDERILGGRSHEDKVYFTKNGSWPEQRGRFHYWTRGGNFFVEWRIAPEEEGIGLGTTTQE